MHFETDEDVDNEYCSSNHNAHATHRKSNSLHNESMNLLHLPEKYHTSILDGSAHATLSKSNSLHKKCINLLHLPENTTPVF
jgi:hypothetical protein